MKIDIDVGNADLAFCENCSDAVLQLVNPLLINALAP